MWSVNPTTVTVHAWLKASILQPNLNKNKLTITVTAIKFAYFSLIHRHHSNKNGS